MGGTDLAFSKYFRMCEKVLLKKDILKKKYWIYGTIRSLYFLIIYYVFLFLLVTLLLLTCMLTSPAHN